MTVLFSVDCGLYIVGSTMSGFGTMKSDMDMCLMITEDGVCIVFVFLCTCIVYCKATFILNSFILPYIHNEMGHDYYF